MSELSQKKCMPCQVGTPPLKGEELISIASKLDNWKVVDEHHLEKEYRFKNFIDALAFVNQIGALAEEEGHHPDLFLAWGKVRVQLFTHKINGISESDCIMAAKIDEL